MASLKSLQTHAMLERLLLEQKPTGRHMMTYTWKDSKLLLVAADLSNLFGESIEKWEKNAWLTVPLKNKLKQFKLFMNKQLDLQCSIHKLNLVPLGSFCQQITKTFWLKSMKDKKKSIVEILKCIQMSIPWILTNGNSSNGETNIGKERKLIHKMKKKKLIGEWICIFQKIHFEITMNRRGTNRSIVIIMIIKDLLAVFVPHINLYRFVINHFDNYYNIKYCF